ncbi:MAG: hypothetical protein ACK4SM_04310 [Aquificaceae bacterium]
MLDRRSFIKGSVGGFVVASGGLLIPKLALATVDPALLSTAAKELPEGTLEE